MKQTWKQRLTQARLNRNLTKSDFAVAVGVSSPTVTDWEKLAQDGGIAEMKGTNLTKVCEVLDITAEWLLHGTGKIEAKTKPLALVIDKAQGIEDNFKSDDFIELLTLFQQSSDEGREFILSAARSAEKATGARWKKIGNKS